MQPLQAAISGSSLVIVAVAFIFTSAAHSMPAIAKTAARMANPKVLGSMRFAPCYGHPTHPCRQYLVEALDYGSRSIPQVELRVTDLDRNKVILVDRDVDYFLYMFPLAPDSDSSSAGLLATVWGSADSQGGVKVYLLNGDNVKVVFYNGSRFSPQFIAASTSEQDPIVLLDRYSGGVGAIRPTETQIWQWDPTADKFMLRATVPVEQKFIALAKLIHEPAAVPRLH